MDLNKPLTPIAGSQAMTSPCKIIKPAIKTCKHCGFKHRQYLCCPICKRPA
jgi:hypothetical protein